jgi:heterodisulfide reductase subunit C
VSGEEFFYINEAIFASQFHNRQTSLNSSSLGVSEFQNFKFLKAHVEILLHCPKCGPCLDSCPESSSLPSWQLLQFFRLQKKENNPHST